MSEALSDEALLASIRQRVKIRSQVALQRAAEMGQQKRREIDEKKAARDGVKVPPRHTGAKTTSSHPRSSSMPSASRPKDPPKPPPRGPMVVQGSAPARVPVDTEDVLLAIALARSRGDEAAGTIRQDEARDAALAFALAQEEMAHRYGRPPPPRGRVIGGATRRLSYGAGADDDLALAIALSLGDGVQDSAGWGRMNIDDDVALVPGQPLQRMDYESLCQLQDVATPLPRKVWDRLPEVHAPSGGESCSICLTAYEEGDRALRLPCGHVYHKDCIEMWFKGKKHCCICKVEVT